MPHRYDVLVIGGLYCDLVFAGLERLPEPGQQEQAGAFEMVPGGSFITAAALHRLGLRTGLHANIGQDPFSRFLLAEFRREGLTTALLRRHEGPQRCLAVALSLAHDRAFVAYADSERLHDYDPHLLERRQARCLYLPGFRQAFHARTLLREARRQGCLVVLNGSWAPELFGPELWSLLGEVDVFLPNELEATRVTGCSNAKTALAALGRTIPTVAIKLGPRGAIALAAGRHHAVPAIDVPVVDTTGAGDSFNAGLVYGLLRGLPMAEALRCAAICGGLAITQVGGATAAPTLAQLQARL